MSSAPKMKATRFISIYALLSTFLAFLILTPNISHAKILSSSRKLQTGDVRVGVADEWNDEQRNQFEEDIGTTFDIFVRFVDVNAVDYTNDVKPYLDAGKEVVVVLEFFSGEFTNLINIIAGEYDDELNNFIAKWQEDGNRRLKLRPLHEMNGDWYSWGTYRGGTNTHENYIAAFQHVHNVFSEAGCDFEMQLCYNCDSAGLDDSPFDLWWPGEEYVDIVLCDGYNRAGTSEDHTEWKSFADVYGGGYDKMSLLPGDKPLGVGETGCSTAGDRVQWIEDAFQSLTTDFQRVQEIDWFLITKYGDGEDNWDLVTVEEKEAFGEQIVLIRGELPTSSTSSHTSSFTGTATYPDPFFSAVTSEINSSSSSPPFSSLGTSLSDSSDSSITSASEQTHSFTSTGSLAEDSLSSNPDWMNLFTAAPSSHPASDGLEN